MEDEEIDKPVEGNPKGGSTTGEKENPRIALPEYDPNLPFKEPATREEKWLSTLGSAALESKSASNIAGTNFSISSAGKDLYTPIDLAKGIPDQYEREKFISDHNNRLVQLLDPDKYGIRFNREIADYAAFKEKNYKTETKKFLDELDENQGFLDAAWRTVAKAAGNLALNVGGLVPLVYGLGAGLFTWDSKNIFNNTLFDAWDYMQEGVDKHLVVYGGSDYYYDEQGKQKNFFARFAANPMKSLNADIVPAAAFVAGAVATELIAAAAAPVTGGASLVGNTARLGALATRTFAKSARVIRGLDQLSDFENMRKIASLTQKYRATLGTATTMVRTAGYESSLIARSTYDLTLSKAKENYTNLKRDELLASGYSDQEIEQIISDPDFISGAILAKMKKSAEDASELAWFSNIPLVGFSNMIQFSKVFASGYKINRAISRLNPLKMTGVVKEGGKFAAKAETMGTARRLAGFGVARLKQGVVEGFEEYAQGVIEQGYSDYWSSRFSEDSVKQSVDFMDAMTKAARNYAGSVEGFDSMTIGFLMGMMGIRLPVKFDAQTGKLTRGWESYGGMRQEIKELKKQIEKDKATAAKLNDAPINPMLKAQFENLSRNFAIQTDMEDALKKGDLFTYKNKEYEQFHSYVATRHKMGVSDTIFQDLDEFEKMDLAEFNKQFATPEVHEFTEESRKASLEKAREATKNIIDAHEHVDTAFADTKMAADFARKNFKGVTDPFGLTDALKDQMTFLYGATLNQTKREKELEGQVRELTTGKISPGIVNSILSDIASVNKEGQANFATQARELYKAALNEWKESDPTSFNLYHKQVEPLLQDLILIKQYKSKISKMYDVLFTNKGATQFMSIYEQLAKNAAELAQEEAIKKKEEEQKNARSSNQTAKTNADLKSLGAEDKVDEKLASEGQLADQLLSEMLLEANPDAANTQDLSTLINNIDTDSIISTLQRTPALFKAILERLEKQNKLIPGLNNIDQLPEILAEDPMAAAKISGALNEILTELKNSKPPKAPVAPLNYVDPADHLQPAPSVEAATSLEDIYNTKSEELKKQGIFQPGTNVTEFSIIPITHDKLIDNTTGKVVRNDKTGKFEVWADSTGKPSDHPTDTKKINSPEFLNNSDLTENNREATFKIADNEWNKEARDAKDIAIDVYHGDTFIGRLPAWREGMPVHLLALRQAVVSQEVGLSVAEELGEVTESAEEIQEQIKARQAKLIGKIADIQFFFDNLSGIKKLAQGNKLEVALQEARDEAAKDIQALEEKLANLSPAVNPDLKAKKAEIKEKIKDIISRKSTPEEKFQFLENIPEGTIFINEDGDALVVRKKISKRGTESYELIPLFLNEDGKWEENPGGIAITEKKANGEVNINATLPSIFTTNVQIILPSEAKYNSELAALEGTVALNPEVEAKREKLEKSIQTLTDRVIPNQEKNLKDAEEIASRGTTLAEAQDELITQADFYDKKANERLKKEAAEEGVSQIDIQDRLPTYEEFKEAKRYRALIDLITQLYAKTDTGYDFEQSSQEAVKYEQEELDKIKKRLEKAKTELASLGTTPTSDLEAKKAEIAEIERISKLPFVERIPALIKAGIIASNVTFNLGKRFPIIVNIAGVKVAFYRSSEGTGGKQKGVWTPMFGFGEDKGNPWLIKGDINTQVNVNYNSAAIKEYADILNKTLNWDHDLDKGQVKNHPYYNVLTLVENEAEFNKELYGKKDLGIINGKTDVSRYINSKLQEINAKYDEELNALEKATPAPKIPQTNTSRRGIIDQYFDSIVEQLKNAGMPVFLNEDNLFKKC